MTELIGFIGLGIMGQPMAFNLSQAGYALSVYSRHPEKIPPFIADNASVCISPQAVAEQTDIIITMVSDTSDVEQVILGEQGIIHGTRSGQLVIDMSTVAASMACYIATILKERGVGMLDAPVSGGDKGAMAGTLSIMVGGEKAQFERALPLFQKMGKNIVHVGDHGAGQIAKTCNQLLVSQTILAVGEALLLAKAAGIDPSNVRQALLGGFAYSRVLELHGQRMLDHHFDPGFKARLHQKDLRIALQTAYELGIAIPGAALSAQYLNALVGTEQGDLDSSALLLIQEKMLNISLKKDALS
jgi:2-hydroxy-3-oxopropionate reductase